MSQNWNHNRRNLNINEMLLSDMHIIKENSHRSLKSIPTVKVLRLIGCNTVELKRQLMQATPNVETLVLAEDDFPWTSSPPPVGIQFIPKIFPNLKALCVMVCNITYRDLYHQLDAEVTGFSDRFCSEMSAKFANKDRLTEEEVADYQSQRRHPSIVDLKGKII